MKITNPSAPAALVDIGGAVYNVKGYGAKGDGLADDSAAIQVAIDAAAAAGGGTVFVPASGAYFKIGAALQLKSNVRLVGAGIGSLLQHDAADAGDVVVVNARTDFEISNLHVKNSGQTVAASAFGIRVTGGSRRGWIHHCTVENSWLGIGVLDVPGAAGSSEVSVCDNVIHDVGNNGIGINSFGTANRADRNLIYNFGTQSAGATVAAGIETRGSLMASASGNEIRDGNYDAPNATVDGIRIEYATEGATAQVQYAVFHGNTIRNVSGHGFRVQWSRRCSIIGNTLTQIGTYGILLASINALGKSSEDNIIQGNYIEGASNGIRFESDNAAQPTRRNRSTGNVIVSPTANGIQFLLSDDNECVGDQVFGAGGVGILHTSGNRNSLVACKALNGAAAGISITAGDSVRVVVCESYDNQGVRTQTFGFATLVGATNTLLAGGIYYPNLTGAFSDASANTQFQGPINDMTNSLPRWTRPMLFGTATQRGLGAFLTIKAQNDGTEGLIVERKSATQTADIFYVCDQNGNALCAVDREGFLRATKGITTKTKVGAPVDGDFAVVPGDGTLVVNTATGQLYIRSGGAWLALPGVFGARVDAKIGIAGTDGVATTAARSDHLHQILADQAAGAPADAPADGTIRLDTTNSKLWVRIGGVWKGVVVA